VEPGAPLMVRSVVFYFSSVMYFLYLDESGNESDPADRFFVLAGVAVFERVTFFLSQSLEGVQTKHFPGLPPIEFHASPIRTGKGFWRNIPEAKRMEVLDDIADVIANANEPGVSLFAAAIEKSAAPYWEVLSCTLLNRSYLDSTGFWQSGANLVISREA
jgi:hypothetical protein